MKPLSESLVVGAINDEKGGYKNQEGRSVLIVIEVCSSIQLANLRAREERRMSTIGYDHASEQQILYI